MSETKKSEFIIDRDDVVLITGATGFMGPRVVESLVERGFRRIRCLVRPSMASAKAGVLSELASRKGVEIARGNLLSMEDCVAAAQDAKVVIHLAAGRGEKSFPDAFLNSVVTTRNLLEACLLHRKLRRFVNISSFAVYANDGSSGTELLDENALLEEHPEIRGEAYTFAKAKQEQLVAEYAEKHKIPSVMIRPGWVYGPGNTAITGRVGVGTFGIFLHLGGSNSIPLTYVDNCAEAIVLAGVMPGVDGEAFNVVDDDLPSSRQFLRMYKRKVRRFRSLWVPRPVSYSLCQLWESYSTWSEGQLPPSFNRSRWNSLWRKTLYSNEKLKSRLGWRPVVSTAAGLQSYFEACRAKEVHA